MSTTPIDSDIPSSPHNVEGEADWRAVAQRDQVQKQVRQQEKQKASSEIKPPTSNDSGWRTWSAREEKSEEDQQAWRQFQLSEDSQKEREAERRSKMIKRSEKRLKKSEEAKRSWSSRRSGLPDRSSSHRQTKTSRPVSLPQQQASVDHKVKLPRTTTHSVPIPSSTVSPPPPDNLQTEVNTSPPNKPPTAQAQENRPPARQNPSFDPPPQLDSDPEPKEKKKKRQKRRKTRPPIDANWVRNAGLHYLGRFSPSEGHFRTILHNKIKRAETRVSDLRSDHEQWVNAAVEEAKRYGGLNDSKLALSLTRSLQRSGLARAAARQRLLKKRLNKTDIERALDEIYTPQEGEIDPTLAAAARAAKKKRLGPWGPHPIDYQTKQKQLAVLARRGFSYSIARKILESDREEAEEWLSC